MAKFLDATGLTYLWGKITAAFQPKITASGLLKGNGSGGVTAATAGTDYAASTHNHAASDITSGVTNNTSTATSLTANTNLITANTLRYHTNRTTSVAAADTGYSTVMARGIYAGTSDMTPGSTSLTNGVIYLQYEA